jgi:hypothetical protein
MDKAEKEKRIVEIKGYDLQVLFIGDEMEEKIAKKMLIDLATKPTIVGIDFMDVKRIIGDKPRRLVTYTSKPPFNIDEFKKFMDKSDGIVYAIYVDKDFSLKQINPFVMTIMDLYPLCLGAPFWSKNKTKDNVIKVVALI